MQSDENPRLCGGVFLTYLLGARKQRFNARRHFAGEADGLSETAVFAALIRVINPDYLVPSGETFKQNTSSYKNCRKSNGTYLPFTDTAETRSFDDCVRTDYQVVLSRMLSLTDKYLETGTQTKKDKYLVETLMEIIAKDDTIGSDALFYACEDGSPVSKSTLIKMTHICLQAFLIGVWHYVLQYCPDNLIGRVTTKTWRPTAGFLQRLTVHNCTIQAEKPDCADETATDHAQPIIEESGEANSDEREHQPNQTVNNPVIFNQYGNNGIQIGSIGTLVIKHGD